MLQKKNLAPDSPGAQMSGADPEKIPNGTIMCTLLSLFIPIYFLDGNVNLFAKILSMGELANRELVY